MVKRALAKVPVREATELRTLYNDRYEAWLMALGPAILAGDLNAFDRGIKIMAELRKMNAVDMPEPKADDDPMAHFAQLSITLDSSLAGKMSLAKPSIEDDEGISDAVIVADDGSTDEDIGD